tara:strand:+ start:26231 stop:26809 length:579 start_codon:yes stop_codon:yes gene_type:complete
MIRKIFLVYSVFTLNACESPIQDNYTISTSQGEIMIENFTEKSLLNWNIVNDTVMGGRSQARMRIYNNMAEFKGYLSLANNGGFSSVRAYYPNDLIDISSVVLRVKGDGRKYSFRVRTDNNSWASYTQSFSTKKDTWEEITLNINDFYPTYRGYNLRDIPKLSESIIREVGLMISDKVEGSFKIDIDWIKVQ